MGVGSNPSIVAPDALLITTVLTLGRVVMTVRYDANKRVWLVESNGRIVGHGQTEGEAVRVARALANS